MIALAAGYARCPACNAVVRKRWELAHALKPECQITSTRRAMAAEGYDRAGQYASGLAAAGFLVKEGPINFARYWQPGAEMIKSMGLLSYRTPEPRVETRYYTLQIGKWAPKKAIDAVFSLRLLDITAAHRYRLVRRLVDGDEELRAAISMCRKLGLKKIPEGW